MAGVKEIKARMEGVRETRKITNAMYLVASTKLRHAREALEKTRPYFDALRHEVVRAFRADENADSRYFTDPDGAPLEGGVCGVLVITADKGLAGSYNLNVLRKAESILAEKPGARLFTVGEYGRRYFRMRHVETEKDFRYTAQDPTLARARDITTLLLDLYDNYALNELVVVYTDLKNSMSATAKVNRLLPLERPTSAEAAEEGRPGRLEFIPSAKAVLSSVMRSYISGFIYSAMVDSFCSEQNARVAAMDSAGRNADELLAALSLQLNRERQSAITQEITEISAGAKAQKKNRQEGGVAS